MYDMPGAFAVSRMQIKFDLTVCGLYTEDCGLWPLGSILLVIRYLVPTVKFLLLLVQLGNTIANIKMTISPCTVFLCEVITRSRKPGQRDQIE